MPVRFGVILASAWLLANAAGAQTACRQADAVYGEPQAKAVLSFTETAEALALSNRFTLTIGETALDGIVMWTAEPLRPDGTLMLDCPDGDVTGQELEQCTLWRGVIYAVDESGAVGLLPDEKSPAARVLILPDLAFSLGSEGKLPPAAGPVLPFDVFTLSGCRS